MIKPKKEKKKTSKKEHHNPQTGDSIMPYMAMLPISISGLIGATVGVMKKEFE